MTTNASLPFRNLLRQAIQEMYFLSESEAGLELLPPDPALCSQAAVAAATGGAGKARISDADTFLQSIRDSVDPGDSGLSTYLQQWEDLFLLLKNHTADICVYRHGSDPVIIDVAAIIDEEAVIIRTSAVET